MPKRPDKVVYFTKEDKIDFLNIISKYKEHFDKNDFSELNVKTKKDFWKLIEKEYNDISPKTGPRSAEQLQCLFKNLKRKARNDAIKEIGSSRTIQCSIDENTDSNENQTEDHEAQYIFLKPSLRSSSCVSEAAESSTTLTLNDSNEEFVVQPLVTLESIQNSLCSNSQQSETIIKQKTEPVSSTKRNNDEQYSLKMKLLKFELETKKKEANLNYEICLLRKEVEWKNKETAVLEKKAKLEQINNQRVLMKLQQENEILRNKILKIELAKAQESLKNIQSNSDVLNLTEEISLPEEDS